MPAGLCGSVRSPRAFPRRGSRFSVLPRVSASLPRNLRRNSFSSGVRLRGRAQAIDPRISGLGFVVCRFWPRRKVLHAFAANPARQASGGRRSGRRSGRRGAVWALRWARRSRALPTVRSILVAELLGCTAAWATSFDRAHSRARRAGMPERDADQTRSPSACPRLAITLRTSRILAFADGESEPQIRALHPLESRRRWRRNECR